MVTTVSFSRKCNTSDIYDVVLSSRDIFLLYAYGNVVGNAPMYHENRAIVPMNFFANITEPPAPIESVNYLSIHGSLMMISWSVLVIPTIILARYFKKKLPSWFTFHWAVNLLALAATVVAFILARYGLFPFLPSKFSSAFHQKNSFSFFSNVGLGYFPIHAHSIIGIMTIVLSMIQGVLGQVANKMWREGKLPSLFPDKVHWYLGRVILVLAILCIYLGLNKFGGDITSYILYSVHLALTIAFVIFLEVKIGAQGEYQPINEDQGGTKLEPSPILLLLYWGISSSLVALTLVFALT